MNHLSRRGWWSKTNGLSRTNLLRSEFPLPLQSATDPSWLAA